jgi:hypothetical protein
LIRLRAALLPIAQSAERDVVARSEFLLSQIQSAAEYLCPRRPLHSTEIRLGQRLRVTIPKSDKKLLTGFGDRAYI